MTKYTVYATHSITATVEVETASAEAAAEMVNRRDFKLPPRDEWTGSKDWEYAVFSPDGTELGRDDGSGYYETGDEDQEDLGLDDRNLREHNEGQDRSHQS